MLHRHETYALQGYREASPSKVMNSKGIVWIATQGIAKVVHSADKYCAALFCSAKVKRRTVWRRYCIESFSSARNS